MPEQTKRGTSWFWRRSMAYVMTAFCMTILTWLAWYGRDGTLHVLIAEGAYWLLGGIFLIYVAGATAEDVISVIKGVRSGFGAAQEKDKPA